MFGLLPDPDELEASCTSPASLGAALCSAATMNDLLGVKRVVDKAESLWPQSNGLQRDYNQVNIHAYRFASDINSGFCTFIDFCKYGTSALMCTARYNNVPMLLYLLRKTANPAAIAEDTGMTALMHACAAGATKAIRWLWVWGGPDQIALVNHDGNTALTLAIAFAHLPTALRIARATSNWNCIVQPGVRFAVLPKAVGTTLLMLASRNGTETDVIDAIAGGADVNIVSPTGLTALSLGIWGDNVAIVQHLIRAGANVNFASSDGRTALMEAAYNGSPHEVQLVEMLVAAGADVFAKDSDGCTALMLAGYGSSLPLLQALLDAGACANDANNKGYSCLSVSSSGGHLSLVQALLRAGARVNHVSDDDRTPLMCSIPHGHCHVVQTLLEAGADADYANSGVISCLMLAAQVGNANIINLLLQAGALINRAVPLTGYTALMCASRVGRLEVTKELIHAGADLHALLVNGDTALRLAVINKHADVVRELLRAGSDVNYASSILSKSTVGFANFDTAVIRIMLACGAQICFE
jgi:ankyrin repeat protein